MKKFIKKLFRIKYSRAEIVPWYKGFVVSDYSSPEWKYFVFFIPLNIPLRYLARLIRVIRFGVSDVEMFIDNQEKLRNEKTRN